MSQVVDLSIFRETRQVVRIDSGARQKVTLRPVEKRKRMQCLREHKDLLFPAIEFAEWAEVIGLKPVLMRCDCGETVTCEVPFITPGGEAAGLLATPCSCGSERLNAIHHEFADAVKKRYGFVLGTGRVKKVQ